MQSEPVFDFIQATCEDQLIFSRSVEDYRRVLGDCQAFDLVCFTVERSDDQAF